MGYFSDDWGGLDVTWENLSMDKFVKDEENFHEVGAGFSSTI